MTRLESNHVIFRVVVHHAGVDGVFLEFYAQHLHKLGQSLGDKRRKALDGALEEVACQIFFENAGDGLGLIPMLINLGADPLQSGAILMKRMDWDMNRREAKAAADDTKVVLSAAQGFVYFTFLLFVEEREKLSDAAISQLHTDEACDASNPRSTPQVAKSKKRRKRNRKKGRGGQQGANQVSAGAESAENVTSHANVEESNSVDMSDSEGSEDPISDIMSANKEFPPTIRPTVPLPGASETSTTNRDGRHIEWLKSLPGETEFEFQSVPSDSAHGLLGDADAGGANDPATMYDRMKEQIAAHPKALALDIQPQHLLGVDTNELSDAQLEELEKLHLELMRQCIELRIQRARRQGSAAAEESIAVRLSSNPQ